MGSLRRIAGNKQGFEQEARREDSFSRPVNRLTNILSQRLIKSFLTACSILLFESVSLRENPEQKSRRKSSPKDSGRSHRSGTVYCYPFKCPSRDPICPTRPSETRS